MRYQLQRDELPHSFIGDAYDDGKDLFERIGLNAYRMRRNVQVWLDDNVGQGNCSFLDYGCYADCQWYVHLLYQGYVISFREHDKAMLFRLTWG